MNKYMNAFLRGMGSIFNIMPNIENRKNRIKIEKISVEEALYRDWCNVGNDLRKAMKGFELEHSALFPTKPK